MQSDPVGSTQTAPLGLCLADSTSLEVIERQITEETIRIVSSKFRICLLLSRIMLHRYYREAGYTDFKSYLKAERIPINYKTACAYARIGEVAQSYESELNQEEFSEEDGIEKLRYLELALRTHPEEQELVFSLLKTSSFRSFLAFARGHSVDKTPVPKPRRANRSAGASGYRLKIEDDTISLLARTGPEREVVWLNPDVFTSVFRYEQFTEELARVVQSYFCSEEKQ